MAKKTASRSTALAIKHALARRPAPIVKPIIVKPAPVKVMKPKRHPKHHGRGRGMLGGFVSQDRIGKVVGALAVGFLEKQGLMQQLPALPLIGRKGTIALAAHFFGGGSKLANDICDAALILAAHEFGSTGTVSGEYVAGAGVDYVAGF